jgi:hypothetical protein
MIREWVRICAFEHHTCITDGPTGTRNRPTRLIYIGDENIGEISRLVVVDQAAVEDLHYAALSYCWGASSSHRMTTTSKTFSERLGGISWDTLPPTYRDAFIITRVLQLQYIWIDSLCIIQDDEQDWRLEAAKMGDIYRHALITIGAVAANSTDDGFINRAPPKPSIRIPFKSSRHPEIRGHFYAYSPGVNGDQEAFFQDVELSKWNKRGWTFQERLLSRRILFFGKQMLHFECRTLRRSENYSSSLKRSIRWHDLIQNGYRWKSLIESWRTLVTEYSARTFTFGNDALPALSSLAQEFSNAQTANGEPVRYIAGLWMRDLCEQLLWVGNKSKPLQRSNSISESAYIAPTWSWCSSKGVVTWLQVGVGIEIDCRFLDANISAAGADSMGGVTDGYLVVEGMIKLQPLPSPESAAIDLANNRRHVFELEDTFGSRRNGRNVGIFHVDFDIGMSGEEKQYALFEGICLALLCHKSADYERVWSYGLVLIPSGWQFRKSDFRKIGVFQALNAHKDYFYDKQVYKIV